MAEPLCDLSGGEIRAAPLAAILVEALRVRATGELRVDARGGTSRVYFRGGQPCGAQVFFGGFMPLGQFLLEQGWIGIEALDRSLAAVADGRKQGEVLVEMGYLTREKLLLGLALHHQHHLRKLASVTEGTYSFRPLSELPPWTDELRLAGHRAIVDALATEPGRSVCKKILRRVPAPLGVRLRTGWSRYTGHFQLDPAEQIFVASLEAPISVEAALATRHVAEERGLALLAALHLMGILVPAPLGGAGPWATPGPELPRTPGPVSAGPPLPRTPGPASAGPPPHEATPELDLDATAIAPAELRFEPSSSFDPERTIAARPGGLDPADRAALEHEQREAQEATRRLRAKQETAARVAREEALRQPAHAVASHAHEARERRARMLQRAFGNIPGGEVVATRRDPTPGPVEAGPAARFTPGPIAWEALPPPGDPAFERLVNDRLHNIADLDHFARLGLARAASRDEIKQAFFAVAKRFHPDRIPAAAAHLAPQLKEIFAALNESYQLLQDDDRRRSYLAELSKPALDGRSAEKVRKLEAEVAAAFKRRDFAGAQQRLAEALAIEFRPDLRAHLLWARQMERPDETGQVRAGLEALTDAHPECASAWYYLGVLARVAGDTMRAETFFLKALEIMPDHREARQELRLIELRKAANPHLRRR